MRLIGVRVDLLVMIPLYMLLTAFLYGDASELARIVIAGCSFVLCVLIGLASLTVITDDGIRYLTPFKSPIDASEIEGVTATPARTSNDTRQLCVIVNGEHRRVSNVTSRNLRDEPFHELIPALERRWLSGGLPPSSRWWPCW